VLKRGERKSRGILSLREGMLQQAKGRGNIENRNPTQRKMRGQTSLSGKGGSEVDEGGRKMIPPAARTTRNFRRGNRKKVCIYMIRRGGGEGCQEKKERGGKTACWAVKILSKDSR